MNFLLRSKSKTYNEAKLFLIDKKIKTQREYGGWIKGKSIYFELPCNPRKFYKNEWKGWGDFLNSGNIAYIEKKNIFYSYSGCSKFLIENGIKSKREFYKFIKINNDGRIPTNPYRIYKEWTNWESFFGKNKRIFLDFKEAKEYVHELRLKSVKDWLFWYKKNKVNFLPVYPNNVYKEWISWMDWLNTDNISKRISEGSKSVERFLIENNIEYISEKTFKDCKNLNLLYFDFYLPKLDLCIEYDGVQHYKPIDRFGGDIGLKAQKTRDSIKNIYCAKNNIKLIRIPYWEQSKINEILLDKIKII